MFPLCLNTATIQPTPLMDKIDVAARAGFDMIELWSNDVEAFVKGGGTLSQVRSRLLHAGLRVPSMIALSEWADGDAAAFARGLEIARDRLETAAALECPYMVASPPFARPVDLAAAGERYGALLDLGREVGVLPAMEFLGFVPQINTLPVCMRVLAYANDADSTVVLDPFHIFRGGGYFEDVALVPGRQVAICHFDDAPADKPREQQGDADRVMPGDGVLPLAEMLRTLRAVGYHGPVSLELFNRALWEKDPLEVAKDGIRRMRAIVDRTLP